MPLLEQPWRPRTPPARRLHRLILLCRNLLRTATRRHWPVVWLACHLLGLAAGGSLGTAGPPLVPAGAEAWVVRTTAVLPALLAGTGTGGALLVWAAVTAGAAGAGQAWTVRRQQRRTAVAPDRWSPAAPVVHRGAAVVRATGWARPVGPDGWQGPARLLDWRGATGSASAPRRGEAVLLRGEGMPPAPGELWTGLVALEVPPAAGIPGAFDFRRFLAGRDIRWSGRRLDGRPLDRPDPVAWGGARLLAPLRAALLGRLADLLPPREEHLAGAVLLGARTATSREIADPFAGFGLAHLFAVSGLHVGVLLGLVLLPARRRGWAPSGMLAAVLVFVPLYGLLTGLPGSVVRAGGMAILAGGARPAGRRADPVRLLGLLFWGGSLTAPVGNLDAGLQLSYLAALGILLVGRATDGFRLGAGWARPVVGGLLVSGAAQWFTLPLVAAGFGRISLVSPLANLVAVPLFAAAVWLIVLGLVAGAVWLPLGQAPAAVGWLILRLLSGGVAAVGGSGLAPDLGLPAPGPPAVAGWLALTAVLFGLLRVRPLVRRRWPVDLSAGLLVPALGLLVCGPLARSVPDRTGVLVWQFAVGQGDCALLAFPDGWTALIDCAGRRGFGPGSAPGPLGREILPFLRRHGVRRLDTVVLTHGHLDHTGGAPELARDLSVGKWCVAGRADRALQGLVPPDRVARPVAGDVLHRWRDWTLRVAHPVAGMPAPRDENDASLVVVLTCGQAAEMVWSGDLEHGGEAVLVAAEPALGPARVWKAGHHGSDTSGSPPMLAGLQPRLILISCGVGNRYGHPSHGPYLLPGRAPADTIAVLRTDLDGSIRLRWAPDGGLGWRTRAGAGEIGRPP